jgi:soluble lytic murein transglycosylase
MCRLLLLLPIVLMMPLLAACAPERVGEGITPSPTSGLAAPANGPLSTLAPPPPSPSPPTPTPTVPPPPELLDRALERRSVRDDVGAAHDFLALLENYPQVPEARRARYYLAESFARRERWTSAVSAFRDFVEEPVQDSLTPPALFWLARGYEEAGNGAGAVEAYARYRQFNTVLEPYAAIRQAAQQRALGNLTEAARNYEHAATTDIDRGQRAASYEHAIAIYQEIGNTERVLQLYQALLDLAEMPGYRARILAEAAHLAETMGQNEQAQAWRREIVATAPTAPQAISAIDTLIQQNDPHLSPAAAARALFASGRYDTALPFFDSAIAQAPPGEERLELRRMRAMALRSLGNVSEALGELAAVSEASPDSEPGRQAQLDWIQTLGQSGETRQAAEAYQQYAATYPDDPRAPQALDRAAQLLNRLGDTDGTLRVWLELEQRYPDNEVSAYGLHQHALWLFRSNQANAAHNLWQGIADGREGYWNALGSYWAGRAARQQNQHEQADALFEAAHRAAPDSYYGTRAAEALQLSRNPTLLLDAPMTEQDWDELEAWVATWSGDDPPPAAEHSYPQEMLETGYAQRAVALNQVGLQTEAIAEWNGARDLWEENPIHLMLLARMAHQHDVPYIALLTARQLAALAPPTAPPDPPSLRRLLYPTPYPDLVAEQSRIYGLDPRLLYALIRQESMFNPFATSWVGARGLGQVMPATGQGIAAQLGIEHFHIDDLYRPHISVRFSAYYLSQQIAMMQGNIQGGLSAYNGGPGNAQRWAGGSTSVGDADLFTEGIDYNETRNYVKLVYGYYGAYQELYTWP